MKVLTISVAAYNVENYIRKALDSLIDEDVIDELEIFVVDDGGTDGTLSIAREYADRYPDSVFPVHKENGGYGSTINHAVRLATGKYFRQLDGDDWFRRENLKEYIALLKATDADVVLNPNDKFYEETGRTTRFHYDDVPEGDYRLEDCPIRTRFCVHTAAFRTELLQRTWKPLTGHSLYTDSEFVAYPLPYLQTICISHLTIYVYRVGGRDEQSYSISSVRKHYQEMEQMIEHMLEVYEGLDPTDRCRRILMTDLLQSRISELFRFFCLLPLSPTSARELRSYAKKLENRAPELLDAAGRENSVVRVLRKTRYLAYPAAHIRIMHNWRDPNRH